MEVVGSRFRRHQDCRSRARSELSGVRVREHFELCDVVDRREHTDTAGRQFVIIHAIQQPVRAVRARAAHRE